MNSIVRLSCLIPLLIAPMAWGDTLSSNLDANFYFTEIVGGDTWIGSAFATGSESYTLSSATLLMQRDTAGTAVLGLYSDASGAPGSLLGSLGAPSSFSSSLSATEFSGANLALMARTNYWLVLRSTDGSYEWAYTDNNTGSGPGFVGDWAASDDAGGQWLASDIDPMMMRVDATPTNSAVPEPAEFILSGSGVLALAGLLSRRGRVKKGAQIEI